MKLCLSGKVMLQGSLIEYLNPVYDIYRPGPRDSFDERYDIRDAETGIRYAAMFEIGATDATTVVYEAFFRSWVDDFEDIFVAMKKMNVDQQSAAAAAEYEKLTREVQKSVLVPHHPNILGIKAVFTDHIYKSEFYVGMPFMELGSLRSIMTYKFNNGLSEESIAVVLKQTLMGLSHLHLNAQLHRDINAGHIFFSHYHGIKLAFAATVYEHDYGNHHLRNSTVSVSTGLAAAPEVFYSNDNDDKYTQKADIWLIGITALELAYGGIPVSDRRGLEKMINKIINKKKLPPKKERGLSSFFKPLVKPCCGGGGGGGADLSLEFSECFGKMVSKCLDTEPAQRPTTFELLEDEFFKNCSEDVKYFLTKSTPLPHHYY